MPITTFNYYEAVGHAEKLTDQFHEVHVVVTFKDRYRVLKLAHHIDRTRVLYQVSLRKPPIVPHTEEARLFVMTHTIAEAALHFKCKRSVIYQTCLRRGWEYVERKNLCPPRALLSYTVQQYGVELAAIYFKVEATTVQKWCKAKQIAVK